METMETVIENVKDVAPAEAAQTAVKVATTKSSNKVVKTGGIVAGVVALVVGIGVGIYRAIENKKAAKENDLNFEVEVCEDNEPNEDDWVNED